MTGTIRLIATTASALVIAGCGAGPADPLSPALDTLVGAPSPFARGDDTWEVWTCEIPVDTTASLYARDPWRLPDTPSGLADDLDSAVGRWTAELSHDVYRARFVPGGTVRVPVDGDDDTCVDAVLDLTEGDTDAVLVVATAAHRADEAGGWGRPGTCGSPCTRRPVRATGRAIYVGASDFHPSWGEPAFDLIEHELGHALDLPHSGDATSRGTETDRYTSALDMMSDPTAPRSADPDARHAQGTIGANRAALGWIPRQDLVVVEGSHTIRLAPVNETEGDRLAIVDLDEQSLLTVEYLTATGLDTHLPHAGVAVHLIELPDCSIGPCTGSYRVQRPLVGDAPHLDLLGAGESIDTHGWRITVADSCPTAPNETSTSTCSVAFEPI